MGEAAVGSMHRHALFAVGLILLLFSLALNFATEWLLTRSRRKA